MKRQDLKPPKGIQKLYWRSLIHPLLSLDEQVHIQCPFLTAPLDFAKNKNALYYNVFSRYILLPEKAAYFKLYSDASGIGDDLPWLNVDYSLVFGTSRVIGVEEFIALDYRKNLSDPRVVVTRYDHKDGITEVTWVECASSFDEFAKLIRL